MQNKINQSIKYLNNCKIILYPTDTIYGLGCDATNEYAVKKIYKIKQRNESKNLIILVDSLEMLQKYVSKIPKEISDYLKTNKEPTTVIYNNPINLAKNVIARDNTIAIRIVKKGFTHELIKAFKKPIVSTSANISGQQTPLKFELIEKLIINKVDYIVSLPNYITKNKTSTIIKFENNKVITLRD